MMETSANKVKPATAYLNMNSIFIINTCINRQIRNMANRMVAIYNEWLSALKILYSEELNMRDLMLDIDVKNFDKVYMMMSFHLEYDPASRYNHDHYEDKPKRIQ